MDSGYTGEIRLFPYDRIPEGWLAADGRQMPVNRYTALFALLGDVYGGDGKTTFALPDLRGRVAIGRGKDVEGNDYPIGLQGGLETVTLTVGQLPIHNHRFQASAAIGTAKRSGKAKGAHIASVGLDDDGKKRFLYKNDGTPNVQLHPGSLTAAGGSQPHTNMQPSAVMHYCICISGIFPPRGD